MIDAPNGFIKVCFFLSGQVRVAEEAGSVRLLVVRAQGLVGEVTVEWRTIDGTAVSSGKTSPDYVVSAYVLILSFFSATPHIVRRSLMH